MNGGAGPRVLLIGMMGAGKTRVGQALSRRTGWPYLDNDELVAAGSGTSTPGLLRTRGESALRAAEAAALQAALDAPAPVIAAVAGGVVDDDAALAVLRGAGFVVYLRARIDTLVRRVGAGTDRPWLGADPRAELTRLFHGRERRYQRAASLVVDVDDIDPDEAAALVTEALGSR